MPITSPSSSEASAPQPTSHRAPGHSPPVRPTTIGNPVDRPSRRPAAPRDYPGSFPEDATNADETPNRAGVRHVNVIQVSRARLDELSQALAVAPLTGDAFGHLIRGEFADTVLANPMAERLVADAMPLLLPLDHPEHAIWQDVLMHALMLRTDAWQGACLALRPSLSARAASTSLLFSWMRDALYRPESLSADRWHAYLAYLRQERPDADAQQVAIDYQNQSPVADKQPQDIQQRLCAWLPALDEQHIVACMHIVRTHGDDDRGLLDVRIALPEALDQLHGADDAIRDALANASGRGDDFIDATMRAAGVQVAGENAGLPTGECCVAAMLLDVGRDARLTPELGVSPAGRYDTWSNALVSLLHWPGQLRGVLDATASALFAAEYAITHGASPVLAAGLGAIPGWMENTYAFRRPLPEPTIRDSETADTPFDRQDFNDRPHDRGIALETMTPVGDQYRRAGYLIERDRQTENFLRRQTLDDYPTLAAKTPGRSLPLQERQADHDYPATDAYRMAAPFLENPDAPIQRITTPFEPLPMEPLLEPLPSTLAGALTGPGIAIGNATGRPAYFAEAGSLRPLAPPIAPASQAQNSTVPTAAWPPRFDTRGDVLIMHAALREQQYLLQQKKNSASQIRSNAVFVPVSAMSPAASHVSRVAGILTHLKLSIIGDGEAPERDDLPGITTSGLRSLLRQRPLATMEWDQPFDITLSIIRRNTYKVAVNGTNLSYEPATVVLGDMHVRMLYGYLHQFQRLDTARRRPMLVIRDDGHVTLPSLLTFYGVDLPQVATAKGLSDAVNALRPKAISIAEASNVQGPAATTHLVIDPGHIPDPLRHATDAHGSSDYHIMADHIAQVCEKAHSDYVIPMLERYGSRAEDLLLRGLKRAGGVALKLTVDDTDGEDDTYIEHHAVNPLWADTLHAYFNQSATLLGNYMIEKIRDKDGEGHINIERLELDLHRPAFTSHTFAVSTRDVRIFDIRAATPPFLYADPSSPGIDDSVAKALGALTHELRLVNGEVAQSGKFLAAVKRVMDEDGIALSTLPVSASTAAIAKATDEVLAAYYRISSGNIAKTQRLLIALQPREEEFLGRAICDELDMDPSQWPVIVAHGMTMTYETGPENTGSFITGTDIASRTMLELVYDQTLRKRIGLAPDREAVCASLAASLANACVKPCNEINLATALNRFFLGFGVLDSITVVSNSALPDALQHPGYAYSLSNARYVDAAVGKYERLEAERIVLVSATAASRVKEAERSNRLRAGPADPIDFRAVLDQAERSLLDAQTAKFRGFMAIRHNTDRFADLQSGWEQAAQQLKDIALEVCRNAPLPVCMAVNLIDDIAEGADSETIAIDGLFYISSMMHALKNAPLHHLGALLQEGTNAWTLERSVEAYRAAVKEGRYGDADKSLSNILMSGHSLLGSGAAVLEHVHGRISAERIEAYGNAGSPESRLFEESTPLIPTDSASNDLYIAVDKVGTLASRGAWREILSPQWNGDLIVEGGAHAIKLSHEGETVYMLGGLPCQAIRTPFGWLEIRPLRDLSLTEHRWQKDASTSAAAYLRTGIPPFPEGFSGPAVSGHTSRKNAAAWYNNHVSTFDAIEAQHIDAGGQAGASATVHIGVLENKYVLDVQGAVEILEHGGRKNGKTILLRSDGSAIGIDVELATWPTYHVDIEAKILGIQGMFAVVEVASAIDGLVAKRTVSGVIALRHTGTHEMVIELDTGVHYRGELPTGALPPLASGEVAAHQEPFAFTMHKISPSADPKRASPAVWQSHGAYRDSGMAHDDFALELLFGAKLANNAYSNNYPWVKKQHRMIASMQHALPVEVRDITNPYYKLTTAAADAILFAPRNRAMLADTLIARDVQWAALSTSTDINFVEAMLRKIQIAAPEGTGDPDVRTGRSSLLGLTQSIPADTSGRTAMHKQIKQKLRNANLFFAEVETKNAKKALFVCVAKPDEAGVVVTGQAPVSTDEQGQPPLELLVETAGKHVYGMSTGSIVDQIEARFPAATDIRSISLFSLDAISTRLAGDVFVSSTNGYPYRSITQLQADVDAGGPGESSRVSTPRSASREDTIHAATINLDDKQPIAQGEKKGAYLIDGTYYVQLDTGIAYRAWWDASAVGFRLRSATTSEVPMETLPLARMTQGRFRLTNLPAFMKQKATLSQADLQRLKSQLATNPTPPLLQGIRQHGADMVIVADPAKVTQRMHLDGSWVLVVDGVEYHPALTPAHGLAYVRENMDEAMTAGCSRQGRGVERLCSGAAGMYIESKDAVKGADLPAEGTDQPEAEDWTSWASDARVYGARPANVVSDGTTLQIVPYERQYCKIVQGKENPVPLKKKELKLWGLPEKVAYKDNVDAHILRRQGHGAQVRIKDFDMGLVDSSMEIGASVFRRTDSDTEWLVTQYDGTWYLGTFDRADGHATAKEVSLHRMNERELLSHAELEIQRLHTGMQNANYHAKTSSPEAMMDILEVSRHLGIGPAEFDRSEYFDTATTGDEAYLFDRATRENVQMKERTDAAWHWLRLDQAGSNTDIVQSRDDLLHISRAIFADQSIETIDDLLKMSGNKKIPLGPKNFLIFRVNADQIYFSISGQVNEKITPALFKDGNTAQIDVAGKQQTIVFIDADPTLKSYMEELDKGMEYPRALPTAATPEQIDLAASTFDITATRNWDTERKMIAYLTYARPRDDLDPVTSVEVFNRNDACKSCALILQHYFKGVPRVIHFYGNEYTKY